MEGFIAGYYKFSVWITRFAYLNLLWILFTLLGFIVFGFMPATAAMFAVVRKWNMGEDDIPIFKTFWKAYREDFLKTNGLGLILFFIGYILIMEFKILRLQESVIYFIVSFSVLAILILYAIVLSYFFSIYVLFNLNIFYFLIYLFIICIVHSLILYFLFYY